MRRPSEGPSGSVSRRSLATHVAVLLRVALDRRHPIDGDSDQHDADRQPQYGPGLYRVDVLGDHPHIDRRSDQGDPPQRPVVSRSGAREHRCQRLGERYRRQGDPADHQVRLLPARHVRAEGVPGAEGPNRGDDGVPQVECDAAKHVILLGS